MITKVSQKEVFSKKKNSVNFSKQNEHKNTTGASNIAKNRLEKAPSHDQFFAASQATTSSQASSSGKNLLFSAVATVLGGSALAYGIMKGKETGALSKEVKEAQSQIEKLSKPVAAPPAAKKKDFTDLLLRGSVDDEVAAQAYLDKLNAAVVKITTKDANGKEHEEVIKVKEHIANIANERIYAPKINDITPRNGKSAVIWMPTSEDLKIAKHGGLAEVPPQLATAWAKNDIATPVIISPLFKTNGATSTYIRRFSNGKEVRYDSAGYKLGTRDSKVQNAKLVLSPEASNIKKLLDFKMAVSNNGEKKIVNMEVFHATDKVKMENGEEREVKRLLIGSDGYFEQGYSYDMPVGEHERFGAVFSKGIYELRKIVEEGIETKAVTDISFPEEATAEGLEAISKKLNDFKPDATVINDWHPSSLSALYSMMAPIEAAEEKLAPATAKRLMEENTSTLFHNAAYQGNTSGQVAANILNTLFGDAAKFVVDTAKITYKNAPKDGAPKGSEYVFKLEGEGQGAQSYNSLLVMGAALSKRIIPVSENYGTEIATTSADTTNIRHIIRERYDIGTLAGITNGCEKFDGGGSIALIQERANMIKEWKKGGVEFKPYDYSPNASIDKNLEAKAHNKKQFITWFKNKLNAPKDPIKLHPEGNTDISDITPDNIKDIPIVIMGTRVVNQKGFDVAKSAIEHLLGNYETRYPNKPQPLILIGGEDGKDGAAKHIKDLKTALGERGKRVVAIDAFTPNPVFQAIGDITIAPSHSEPCGLIQQPTLNNFGMFVGSKVGGHVDTIKDGETGILEPIADFKNNALFRAFDIIHNDSAKFKDMQAKGGAADFSWTIKEKDGKISGPAVEHATAIGIKKPYFKEIAPKVEEQVAEQKNTTPPATT